MKTSEALLGTLLCTLMWAPQFGQSAIVVNVATVSQLNQAIQAANLNPEPTTIELAAGHYHFKIARHSRFGRSATPLVKADITIHGAGAQTTVLDEAPPQLGQVGRIFAVGPAGRLSLSGVTIEHINFSCQEATECNENLHLRGGAAAANFGGVLEISDCVISDNFSGDQDGASGGALYSELGSLLLERVTLTNNGVATSGGALALRSGEGVISNSIFRGNRATFDIGFSASAGAILTGGHLTIRNSTIAGNVAGSHEVDDQTTAFGGGIYNFGTLEVADSAIVENTAGIRGQGGGLYNIGQATLINTTVGGNSSDTQGGGIYNSGTLSLRGVTVAGNHADESVADCTQCPVGGGGIYSDAAGTIEMASSVIANNTSRNLTGPDCVGSIASQGFNALGNSVNCTLQHAAGSGPDKVNLNARLGQLQDNGIPGKARFPVHSVSPLIDAGGKPNVNCTSRDQIGRPRRDGNGDGLVKCDVGAIEFQPPAMP